MLAMVGLCASAQEAEDAIAEASIERGVYAGAHAGTLGLGATIGYDFSEKFGIRGTLNRFDYEVDDVADEYSGDLELRSLGMLLDWHPRGGGFRVTAGAMSNQSAIAAMAATDSVEIGRRNYAGTADLKADFDAIAPYIGMGWSGGRTDGLRVLVDIGVLVQGAPSVSASGRVSESGLGTCGFTVSSSGIPTLSGNLCGIDTSLGDELIANLRMEHRELTADVEDFELWPVLKLGVAYSF